MKPASVTTRLEGCMDQSDIFVNIVYGHDTDRITIYNHFYSI